MWSNLILKDVTCTVGTEMTSGLPVQSTTLHTIFTQHQINHHIYAIASVLIAPETPYASALYAADSRATHRFRAWGSAKGRSWQQMIPATP